jgi:hypothetical protein
LNAKEELLNRKEVIITTYISELNLSRERETSLGTHFIDLKNEKVYLEAKLNKTMLDRERWQNMYNVTQRNYDVCNEKWESRYNATQSNYDVCKVNLQLEKSLADERLSEIIEKSNEMYLIVAILLSALFVLLLFYIREVKKNQILLRRDKDNSERKD